MYVIKFVLESIVETLHWCVVIRTAGLTHTLLDMVFGAVGRELLRCELAPLVAVQYQAFTRLTALQRLGKCIHSQLGIDVRAIKRSNHFTAVQVNKRRRSQRTPNSC